MVPALMTAVRERGARLLGVCLGMQLLADASDEGSLPGLGLLPGHVRRLDVETDDHPPRLPHIGWSHLDVTPTTNLFQGIAEPRFYFAHSYRLVCADSDDVLGVATYGPTFAAAVQRDNIAGFQFHPEKSGRNGMQLLRNFLGM
jgi:glutamine amidotransferase